MGQNDLFAPGADRLKVDSVLLPYLNADTEPESQSQAEHLIFVLARPIIKGIVNYKLSTTNYRLAGSSDQQEVDDVCSEAVLELLSWLRKLKAEPEANAIQNFRGFVAVVAYRACASYLRKKHPLRSSLRARIHYTLSHHSDFAIWKGKDQEWFCGFRSWTGTEVSGPNAKAQALLADPRDAGRLGLPEGGVQQVAPEALLRAIFAWVNAPVKLDDLISAIAELSGIRDQTSEPLSDSGVVHNARQQPSNTEIDAASAVEQRIYLKGIWAEIGLLPIRQRCALLLNLTWSPGKGVLHLLPILGIASIHEIAEALGMTDEALAQIWNTLPLEDAIIASNLGITRQQVINLRKSARERLARRTRAAEMDRELVLRASRS
ncbi:MAG TPA: hypothetical protein VEZ90_18225 [Blastocatellia bacterium]|nr:hypothetical protein [Blastocatellia bacterium]